MSIEPLSEAVANVLDGSPATVGLAYRCLPDGPVFGRRTDDVFTQASAIKIPILWELYLQGVEGRLALDEAVAVEPANGAGGCGVLQHFAPTGSKLTLADMAVLMIALSDNVATNQLLDRVGIEATNERLASFGCVETRVRRKMYDLEARAEGRENTSTPGEAVALMARLYTEATRGDDVCRRVLQTLRLDKESPVADALPPDVRLASKPGHLQGLRTEWAVVEANGVAYALAMMVDSRDLDAPLDDSAMQSLFGSLTKAVHDTVAAA